jgi:hypothetical protein
VPASLIFVFEFNLYWASDPKAIPEQRSVGEHPGNCSAFTVRTMVGRARFNPQKRENKGRAMTKDLKNSMMGEAESQFPHLVAD